MTTLETLIALEAGLGAILWFLGWICISTLAVVLLRDSVHR